MSLARLAEAQVRALWRRVAAQLGVAAVAGLAAALGALLVASWLVARTSWWVRPSVLPLVFWLITSGLAAAWLWALFARARRWDRRAAAREVEGRLRLPRGAVQGAVEPGVERSGISSALARWHRESIGREIGHRSPSQLGGPLARSARVYALSALVLGAGTVGGSAAAWLGAGDSAIEAWTAVIHPVRQLSTPPLPAISLNAETERVRRGRDLPVQIGAPGRDSVRLVWEPVGVPSKGRWYAVSNGPVRASVPRIEVSTRVWAAGHDGATSDTLRVEPFDPLLLLDVQVALDYPPHTGREREVLRSPLPHVAVPQGTRATVAGKTTRPLESVALRDTSGRKLTLALAGERRFRGSFTVRPGVWGWDVRGAEGDTLQGQPDSLSFATIPDSAPAVTIVFPGVDTILSTDMTQPLVVDLRDDYGLSAANLVSWRVSAWGESWPALVEPLPLEGDGERAIVNGLINAQGRGFLPGDTLHYLVQGWDNAPDPQMGQSREYVLRLPTLDEVRERTVAEAGAVVQSVERLAERAREQEEAARALQRSTEVRPAPGTRPEPEPGSGSEAVEYRETEAARRALEEAGALLEEARAIQEELKRLQENIEAAGLNDPSVLERLQEIESLYERILTPELREKLEALREALVDLDAQRIREAIRELAEGSRDFRQRVEQSLELLKRAALEQEFLSLETTAEELSETQQQLADAASKATDPQQDSLGHRLATRASDLGRRADALSERLRPFEEELRGVAEDEAAARVDEAREQSGRAARSDESVAWSSDSRRRAAAAQRAAGEMSQAATALREGRQEMQEGWRQEVVEALERTQAEALELARRQQSLNERLGSSEPRERADVRSEEVALKRGVDQIGEKLEEAARSSLLLDPSLAQAAQQVSQALQRLLDEMGDGTRSGRGDQRLGNQASEALNELAYRLMQAANSAASASSGTGLQEALEQLSQLAQQQGDLNAQAGGVTPGALTDAILQQLRELAARQSAIGEELGEIDRTLGARGQVLGRLDEMGREAEELAREMSRGRLDEEIIQRQNRLFQRLLDAGRTLERDEFDRERRAERPGTRRALRPDALPPQLGVPFPHPPEQALRQFPPALRRLILDYFDRLNGREASGAP